MNWNRLPRYVIGAAIGAHALLVALNVAFPGWGAVGLDREHNVPAYFQSGLLAAAALLALEALRLEARVLGRAGRPRGWAAVSWLGSVALFAYLALDESLVIHERFNTEEMRAWLKASSPLQGVVVWLLILFPAVVGAVGWLVAWLSARARLSPPLARWGGVGLGLWVAALVLEGTAKSVFIPRGLYALEVILEESAEALGTTLLVWALWRYRTELAARLREAALPVPALAVRWGRVAGASALALAVPAALVGASIGLNPEIRQKAIADEHLGAGRHDEARAAYRDVVAAFPRWGRAWDRLGIAEYRRGDLAAAAAAFATAERLEPRNAAPPDHRGAVLFREGRYAEAAEAFGRAARLAPDDPEVNRNLSVALARLGRTTEAAAALRRARALAPDPLHVAAVGVAIPAGLALAYLGDPRLEAALVLTRAGSVDAAIAAYRQAVREAPGLAAAHLGLANELLRRLAVDRAGRGGFAVGIDGVDVAGLRRTVLFEDSIGHPGGWERIEVTVEATAAPVDQPALAREAAAHFRQAIERGAGAPARLGLALLPGETGR